MVHGPWMRPNQERRSDKPKQFVVRLSFVVNLLFCGVVCYAVLCGTVLSRAAQQQQHGSSSSATASHRTDDGLDLQRPSLSKGPGNAVSSNGSGNTKIVAFSNYNFRSVAIAWYERMTRLGYTSHVIVATDAEMVDFLTAKYGHFRFEVLLRAELPPSLQTANQRQKDRAVLQLLMAVRWKYLLQQLRHGTHILLTDADNIFTRYVSPAQFENETQVDVLMAYATKYPRKAYASMGLVVCSGMSWWRASESSIRFATILQETCGDMCDDQRELNRLLDQKLEMVWSWDPHASSASRVSNQEAGDDARFVGLLTDELRGRSSLTGHTVKIWSRDFAYRGVVNPGRCPADNWVSMPILDSKTRHSAWLTKLQSFQTWDDNCGIQIRERGG